MFTDLYRQSLAEGTIANSCEEVEEQVKLVCEAIMTNLIK
jgi:hypothetical protein